DVFQRNGRDLVLVNETWGYYSPAARGESAFAGLYALQGGQLQPLCLYQSYLTPPRTNTLAGLTLYPQLQEELDKWPADPIRRGPSTSGGTISKAGRKPSGRC